MSILRTTKRILRSHQTPTGMALLWICPHRNIHPRLASGPRHFTSHHLRCFSALPCCSDTGNNACFTSLHMQPRIFRSSHCIADNARCQQHPRPCPGGYAVPCTRSQLVGFTNIIDCVEAAEFRRNPPKANDACATMTQHCAPICGSSSPLLTWEERVSWAQKFLLTLRHPYGGIAPEIDHGNTKNSGLLGFTAASGAGKTYTMSGTAAQPGINTRALAALFAMLEDAQRRPLVEVAMMQFYCEHVFDLLASDSGRRLEVCNLAAGGLARGQERVTGLVWTPVATAEAAQVRAGPHCSTAS